MTIEKTKIRAGIIGGAGYTGGELIRILHHHPHAQLVSVQSRSHAGQHLTAVHPDMVELDRMTFAERFDDTVDVLFMCSGHGKSREFLAAHSLPTSTRVIDLSQDFRVGAPEYVYGLPELNRERLRKAHRIANPGCFATAIQLALLPLAGAGLLQDAIHVSAVTGATGAGQSLSPTSHFSWRNNNISVYKPFQHQHLQEIEASLKLLQPDFEHPLLFIPYRGNFTRGILASVYLACDLTASEAGKLYEKQFDGHPFVHLARTNPSVKQVVNTNHCVLFLEKHQGMLHIISIIDNLVKGASGQAVQNMNISFGWEEHAGLQLKPVAF